jgi:hypothetical protein
MTTVAVRDVGFCADFSQQGDWAFDYAFSLAQSLDLGLKVFYVPDLAWDSRELPQLSPSEADALDRHVREYYETRLGDFVDVGFRICEGFADRELRRCLMGGIYQVLVLAYRDVGAPFGGRTIEEFAYAFNGPVVMVGPDEPGRFLINPSAALLSGRLNLEGGEWTVLKPETPVPAGS